MAWESRKVSLVCSSEIPAGASAGLIFPVTCTDPNDPRSTLPSTAVVPTQQVWYVTEVFIKATADVGIDGQVVFRKVGGREVYRTNPVSALLISNPSFPGLKASGDVIEYAGGELWNVVFYTLADNAGTAPAKTTFYIELEVYQLT